MNSLRECNNMRAARQANPVLEKTGQVKQSGGAVYRLKVGCLSAALATLTHTQIMYKYMHTHARTGTHTMYVPTRAHASITCASTHDGHQVEALAEVLDKSSKAAVATKKRRDEFLEGSSKCPRQPKEARHGSGSQIKYGKALR